MAISPLATPQEKLPGKRSEKGAALITGASGDIGRVYADRLARRGYDLILVSRDLLRLQGVAEGLQQSTGCRVDFMGADLTTFEGRYQVGQVLENDPRITLLLNSAGVGAVQPLIESDVNRLCKMIQLNVVAVTYLARTAAPHFVARGQGIIINIASVAALAPELLNGAYAASKSFVLTFSQSLHQELGDKGVQVQAVLPGFVRSDFWSAAGTPVRELPPLVSMSADEMVDAALLGLDRSESVTIPSLTHVTDWEQFELAREAMGPEFLRSTVAERYRI